MARKSWQFAFIFWALPLSIPANSALKLVEIPTHILVHEEYKKDYPEWKQDIFKIIKGVNEKFLEEKIPVSLRIREIKIFDEKFPEPEKMKYKNKTFVINDLVTNVNWYLFSNYLISAHPIPEKHIAIGFIAGKDIAFLVGQSYLPKELPHVCVVTRPKNSELKSRNFYQNMVWLVMHEVTHILGARDLFSQEEKKYLMYYVVSETAKPPFDIDKKNRFRIMRALKKYFQ